MRSTTIALALATATSLPITTNITRSVGDALTGQCDNQFCIFDNEVVATTEGGFAYIGGNGGVLFQSRLDYMRMIKAIRFFQDTEGHYISGVWVTYFRNGDEAPAEERFGRTRENADPCELCEIPAGQKVNEIIVRGNGAGTGVGHVNIKVNGRSDCMCGAAGEKDYRFVGPDGGAFLAGIHGNDGLAMDKIGFVWWKPVLNSQIIVTDYTIISGQGSNQQAQIYEEKYVNCADFEVTTREVEEKVREYEGKVSCFSHTQTFEFTHTVSVSAQIPFVAEVGGETSIHLGHQQTQEECIESGRETERTIRIPSRTIPPMTYLRAIKSQTRADIQHLPWSGHMEINILGGRTMHKSVSGTYKSTTAETYDSGIVSKPIESKDDPRCPRGSSTANQTQANQTQANQTQALNWVPAAGRWPA